MCPHCPVVALLLCRCQGYGDLHAYSVAEASYVVVFMFISIGVAAYFVATSVLLVVENEKKTGVVCAPQHSQGLHFTL